MFRKVLVPVAYGCDPTAGLALAHLIAGQEGVLLVGLVHVAPDESLSAAAVSARQVRKTLRALADGMQVRSKARVRVSHAPWAELVNVIREELPDLLVLEWPCFFDALCVTPEQVLSHPPCDIALARGPIPASPERILVPVRGGPYAELALRLSLAVAHARPTEITSLHLLRSGEDRQGDAPFRGIERVLAGLPEIRRSEEVTDDPGGRILAEAPAFDLVVLGTSGQTDQAAAALGTVAGRTLREAPAGVIAVKTMRPMPADSEEEMVGQTAISILVDKWFAENTFHAGESADLDRLLALKRERELTISLALPALNEEKTVGRIIRTVQHALMEQVPLLDEIVLIDSNSTDRTREIAEVFGVPVYIHQQVLPQYGARRGKGEALWKSLYVTCGDLLVWIDTDVVNIHPRFVYGLIGPLLLDPRIQFVKGFYRRPLKVGDKVQAGGGGRVTELTARPLLNLFYPEVSGVVQPLSGEYGGRRRALEQLPFFSGYGVEIGLLIDVFEKFGLAAIAQVDLLERIHHNQSLDKLSKMSFAIIQAVIRRLERRYGQAILEDVNRTMKLIQYEARHYFLDVEEIAERERPPMVEIAEYRELHRR